MLNSEHYWSLTLMAHPLHFVFSCCFHDQTIQFFLCSICITQTLIKFCVQTYSVTDHLVTLCNSCIEWLYNICCLCDVSGQIKSQVLVGEECSIILHTAHAGPGCVTCHVVNISTSSEVVARVIDSDDGTVSIKYVPAVKGTYTVDIKYGGVTIPAGRITQQVLSVCLPACLSPPISLSFSYSITLCAFACVRVWLRRILSTVTRCCSESLTICSSVIQLYFTFDDRPT